jgi:hypothetical protein
MDVEYRYLFQRRVAVGILYSVSTRGGVVVDDLTFLPCTTAQLEQVVVVH